MATTPNFSHLFTGAAAPENAALPEQKKYRILLVDDEPNVLSALMRVFRQENYDVVTCNSPVLALEKLAKEQFQLIISDYMMPGMNGGDLLKKAREMRPNMIRIMLTGHADVNAVVSAVKTGAVYKFILKPWNDDDLRVTVALALEQQALLEKNRALQKDNQHKAREVEQLSKISVNNRCQLAYILNKHGILSAELLQEVIQIQPQVKEPVVRLMTERGWLSDKVIADFLAKEMKLQQVSLDEYIVDPGVAALIPAVLCKKQLVMPLSMDDKRLLIAMADPLDAGLIDDLRFVTGLELVPILASIRSIDAKIAEVYKRTDAELTDLEVAFGEADPYEGIQIVIEDDDDLSLSELLRETEEPPAIRLVNSILLEAIRLGASDIHIQPRAKNVIIRLRIDGVLTDKMFIPHNMLQPIVSRIKIMAELDISERRKPQDGRLTVKTPKRIVDLRVSALPTINGEKIVMRILERNSSVLSMDTLGFSAELLERIQYAGEKPQGIILATGPTGSGKTTTLYSLLQNSASSEKNYLTIEDPVEYYLDNAGQVLVRDKIGLTFPLILRAILRQDPDVLLIGEIRDFETAEVAFHAALTGHQVFSTLHTNSAIATISRLFDLGLKPFVIATALEAVIAQRLVRKICESCKTAAEPDPGLLRRLGKRYQSEQFKCFKGIGCQACYHTGYKGRVGLYEVLTPDDQMRHLIAEQAAVTEIVQYAFSKGFATLRDDAFDKVVSGLTTPEEILRVLGPE
ncbi:MAG: Flp pilus assembly complex ATPase component TadA [Burkholderiales bacterium]|nr:Flp pilus assembly complex ATPase component TadA [Burkholderiales bacterium]